MYKIMILLIEYLFKPKEYYFFNEEIKESKIKTISKYIKQQKVMVIVLKRIKKKLQKKKNINQKNKSQNSYLKSDLKSELKIHKFFLMLKQLLMMA